jgi:hypothetical protein
MTTTKIDANIVKLMQQCLQQVQRDWGHGWDLLSARQQSALLSERLLITCTQQDESVDPAAVVKILNQGWSWILDQTNR